MKKFQITDEFRLRKVYDHLKSFDKFNTLDISVKTIDLAVIEYTVKIGDEFSLSDTLPHRDGMIGITDMTEDQIEYLSWQVKFFKDVEQLLGSEISTKHYYSRRSDYSLGETTLNDVKYEFHFALTSSSTDFVISAKFSKIENGLKVETEISTEDWIDYSELEQTWSKFDEVMNK